MTPDLPRQYTSIYYPGRGSSRNVILPKGEECTTCHQISGLIIGGVGIYTLFIRNRYPDNKTWLTFVGATTLSFGIYWGVIHKIFNKEKYKD